jgi:hypothetical protein
VTGRYSILVERYRGNQALRIVCERCAATRVIDGDDIKNEGIYACPRDTASDANFCGGLAVHMYAEADRCPSCRRLGFYEERLAYCCSRACMLQADYAKTLENRS